jgi:hypothetical protein
MKNFQVHLDWIKTTFCVEQKLKGGTMIYGILDSRQLDVQAFHFILTMNHNVDVMMHEAFDMNPIIWMWLKVQSSPLLVLKLSEYMKVTKIIMVQVLGSLEDEKTFNNLTFMKSKLCN